MVVDRCLLEATPIPVVISARTDFPLVVAHRADRLRGRRKGRAQVRDRPQTDTWLLSWDAPVPLTKCLEGPALIAHVPSGPQSPRRQSRAENALAQNVFYVISQPSRMILSHQVLRNVYRLFPVVHYIATPRRNRLPHKCRTPATVSDGGVRQVRLSGQSWSQLAIM